MHHAVETLRHPATWLGLLGSLLLAAGELRRLATWRQVSGQPWVAWISSWVGSAGYVVHVATGILLLGLAWLLARPGRGRPALSPVVLLAVWAVPLLVQPPVLSTDAGSYADLGWIVSNGQSPYDVGLGTTGSPFAWGRAWRGTTSVYPALSLWLFGGVVQGTGMHWYWSVMALRVLALAGVGLLSWSLPRLARRVGVDPAFAVWLAVLNPVTLVHGIGGEHVDLLMAGVVSAGLAAALAPRWRGLLVGGALVGVAAAIKQPALLAVPAVAALALPAGRRSWPRFLGACTGAGVAALASFWVVSAATGLDPLGWLDGTGNPANSSQTLTPAYLLSVLTHLDVDTLTTGVQWASIALIGWLFLSDARARPLRFLGLAALVWSLGFGTLREWYLIFPLAFLGLARPARPVRATLWVLVPLLAVYGTWREYVRLPILTAFGTALLWSALVAAAAAGVWAWAGRRAGATASASASAQDGQDVFTVGAGVVPVPDEQAAGGAGVFVAELADEAELPGQVRLGDHTAALDADRLGQHLVGLADRGDV